MSLPQLYEVASDDTEHCARCYDCSGEEWEDDELDPDGESRTSRR
jgi:hypothetical protein